MYPFVLSFRYLIKKRISYFAVFAVALCVFVVLIVITVLNGLTSDFKAKTHRFTGDCVVSTKSLVGFSYYEDFIKALTKDGDIFAAAPVIRSVARVKSSGDSTENSFFDRPYELLGIEPVAHSKVTALKSWLWFDKDKDVSKVFDAGTDSNLPGCIVGIRLLFKTDDRGRYVTTENIPRVKLDVSCLPLTAKGALAQAGASVLSSKTFILANVSNSGVQADWLTMFLPFDQAQVLCGMGDEPKRANAIFIKFKDGVEINKGCKKVESLWQDFLKEKQNAPAAQLFNNVRVQSWRGYNRDMIAVAETQQAMMIIVFAMIGIITVFVVFVIFFMIINHKSKDIGILKSIGLSNGGVMFVFLCFALLIGLLGSAVGSVGGWQFLIHINDMENWLFSKFGFQLFSRNIYAIGDIPNKIDMSVLVAIILTAVLSCLLGAFLPSRQAAKMNPVETLRVSKL